MGTSRRYRGLWVAAGLGLIGCSPPTPSAPPTFAPCLDSKDRLIADVDNDGHLDRITGTEGVGTDLRISFGEESGFAEPRTPSDLLGIGLRDRDEEEVVAAVADFDGDGWLDLAVGATAPVGGDDPVPSRVTELRLGPFSSHGVGQRTSGLDSGTTFGLRVVDYNDDEHPDLSSFFYDGDGVYEVRGLLGGVDDGLTDGDRRFSNPDAWGGGPEENFPPSAMGRFYPACDS